MTQTTEQTVDDLVVTLTDEARGIVADALAQEPNAEELGLWLEVRGVEAGKFAYDLYFQAVNDADDADVTYVVENVAVVIPANSVDDLRGSRLEWSSDGDGGLVMVNPNTPSLAQVAPGLPEDVLAQGLEGPLALEVIAVLERDVNPSIASHGGRADLVAMDENEAVVYLALSGGCQGCAMSRMTLTQGIEVTLRDQVPQLTAIVDVTDHAVGENPFYSN
ncbi:MAG: NifU family protein [Actinomycetes bacterium]|jgi:Fe/S biogenesis protein NfuA